MVLSPHIQGLNSHTTLLLRMEAPPGSFVILRLGCNLGWETWLTCLAQPSALTQYRSYDFWAFPGALLDEAFRGTPENAATSISSRLTIQTRIGASAAFFEINRWLYIQHLVLFSIVFGYSRAGIGVLLLGPVPLSTSTLRYLPQEVVQGPGITFEQSSTHEGQFTLSIPSHPPFCTSSHK